MIFGSAASVYTAAGWTGPLPLPVHLKFPPPDNVTGNYPPIDPNKIEEWLAEFDEDSNIGLRMQACGDGYETIGIDIDQYDSKTGWETYLSLAKKLGPLPTTYKSSARGAANPSGIHFFRVPAGCKWKGKPGADIEVIQRTHRYAAVWPSVVPDKHDEAYTWYQTDLDGDDAVLINEPPNVAKLPLLPQEWIDHILVSDKTARVRSKPAEATTMTEIGEWMAESFPGYSEKPSTTMARAVDDDVLQAVMEAGAHDGVVSKIHSVVRYGVEGHHGLEIALRKIKNAFRDEVLGVEDEEKARRSITDYKSEWERALVGEITKLRQDIDDGYIEISPIGGYSADDSETDTSILIGRLADRRSREVDVDEYPDNHRGVGKMIRDFWGSDLRPISGSSEWAFWDPVHKRLTLCRTEDLYDMIEQAVEIPLKRAAEKLYDLVEVLEADGQDDEAKVQKKAANELMRRSTNAGNVTMMDNSLKVAHALPGERVYLKNFDTNPLTLGVKNGVIDLEGWKAKRYGDPLLREGSSTDLIFANTGVAFDESASHPIWQNYLDTFLPDLEYRRFVRKVMGYALLGGNPQRLMIFLQGPTSTGKTTLQQAIHAATGEYTATVAANAIWREKQDAGPAPELLAALPKRIVFSSEVSGQSNFHADVIKRLTGGDEIAARALYSNEVIVRRPMFTPIIATNTSPMIKHGDAALWRRFLVLPFDTQVPPSSVVTDKIEDHPAAVAAVLCWLIDGLKDYLMESFDPKHYPAVVKDRQVQFIGDTSDFQKFLTTFVVRAEDAYVERDALFQAYEAWAASEGIKDPLSRNWFVRRMSDNGIDHTTKSFRNKSTGKVGKKTVFVGVKLTK